MHSATDCEYEYQAIGMSLPKPGQPEACNADRFGSACRPAAPRALLGVVCDGVSASVHGADAAQTTCDSVLSWFERRWCGSTDPERLLAAALLAAHQQVCTQYPGGSALCTVVSALVVPDQQRFVVAHVGDSAAYRFHAGELEKLTEDHSTTTPVRLNGRVVLQDGVPVMARELTRAVGQVGDFRPDVASHQYKEGDLLCLATDGVFETALARFVREEGFLRNPGNLGKFCAAMREKSEDDTTLLILRLGCTPAHRNLARQLADYGTLDAANRDAFLADVEETAALDAAAMAECLRMESDEDRAIRIVEVMSRSAACLSRDEWIHCLDLAAQLGHRRLAGRLVAIIRRL